MFKPPDNKTDRFKGAIHKLRKRLSCSAIEITPDDTPTPTTSSSSSPTSTSPTSCHSPEPLPPCEWFGGAFRRMTGATKHEFEERYRIAMEIERCPREEMWGEHFTFYSTSTIELELTASRIRDFKEGRYG